MRISKFKKCTAIFLFGAAFVSVICVASFAPAGLSLDTTPPTVSFTFFNANNPAIGAQTLDRGDSIRGVQTINVVANDDEGVARIELYIDGACVESHASRASGKRDAILSYQWDTSIYSEGSHEVKTVAYDYQGLTSESTVQVTVDNVAEKIGVFFYATDMFDKFGPTPGEDLVITSYIYILAAAGYTKFFRFEDSNDVRTDVYMVDDYEGTSDTIFFYLWGHGYSDKASHSYTWLKADGFPTYSWEFRNWMDGLDSPRIGLLVESCLSGGWVADLISGNYMAISCTDLRHLSTGFIPIGGLFSNQFFTYVFLGFSAIQAFVLARGSVFWQLPQITLHDWYDFFAFYNR
ncbi:MAG: Ig-like domain-containing protein [Promethearchaeota archaeon]